VGHSDLSTNSTPVRKISVPNNSSDRKTSVGDLISLANEGEQQVVFDPLLDNQRLPVNPHRRLERTSNPSTGKYENYVPPGGASQPQFRQFLSTMTQPQEASHYVGNLNNANNMAARSSEDLLREYGLNFNNISISDTKTNSTQSVTNHPFHQNGKLSAPAVPPRTVNSSFLHNSGSSFASHSSISSLPINSSLSSIASRPAASQPLPSCRDILADLDPLKTKTEVSGSIVGSPRPLQPPTVPPRTKKQWTTFD